MQILTLLTFIWCSNSPAQGPGEAMPRPPLEMVVSHLIHRADADGDRVTTAREWQALLGQLERQGEITHETVRRYLDANRPKNAPQKPNQATEPQTQRPEPPPMNRAFLEEKYQELDRDGDGSIPHRDLPGPGQPPSSPRR